MRDRSCEPVLILDCRVDELPSHSYVQAPTRKRGLRVTLKPTRTWAHDLSCISLRP